MSSAIKIKLIYLPDFPNKSIHPETESASSTELQKVWETSYKEILLYLATESDEIESSRVKPVAAPCRSTVCKLATYLICNAPLIIKDTFCGCLPRCVHREPVKRTYMMKDTFFLLNDDNVDYNRNLCLVTTCGTATLTLLPAPLLTPMSVSTSIYASVGIAAFTNVISLFFGGCHPSLCAGDFSSKKLHAFHALQSGYDDLAEYLKTRWNKAKEKGRIKLQKQSVNIAKNWDRIMLGMENVGFTENETKIILEKFSLVIYDIKKVNIHMPSSQIMDK